MLPKLVLHVLNKISMLQVIRFSRKKMMREIWNVLLMHSRVRIVLALFRKNLLSPNLQPAAK